MYEKTAFKCEKYDKCYETNAPAAQVQLNPLWNPKKEVLMRTPELVATVDATLAGTVTKHVGVKQGGCQEAEEGDGAEDQSADNCKRKLKLA